MFASRVSSGVEFLNRNEKHVRSRVIRSVKKCSETIVGLDIMLGFSTARMCSLKRSFILYTFSFSKQYTGGCICYIGAFI